MLKKLKTTLSLTKNAVHIINKLEKGKLPLLFLKSLISGALPFLTALLTSLVLDRFNDQTSCRDLQIYALIAVSLLFLLSVLCYFAKQYDEIISESCYRKFEWEKSKRTLTMPYSLLDNPKTDEIRQKMHMQEAYGYGLPLLFSCLDTLVKSILSVLYAVFLLFPVLGGMKQTAVVLTVCLLVIAVVLSSLTASLIKKKNDSVLKRMQEEPPRELLVSEHLMYDNGIMHKDGKIIRLYHFQDLIRDYCGKAYAYMKGFSKIGGSMLGIAYGISGVAKAFIFSGSYLFVAIEAKNKNINLGEALLLAVILYQLSYAIAEGMSNLSAYVSAAESLKLYSDYISAGEEEKVCAAAAQHFSREKEREYEIEFRNVSFRYEGRMEDALKNVSLKIPFGKRVAIVGMNGSGKTTLIKLLCRFYKPASGRIFLNGRDIEACDLNEYLQLFSVVFQDFKVASFTLGQNVAAASTYDEKMAAAACERVGLGERLSKMPDGLETYIDKDYGNGVNLSGGEAQKTAIARAIYKDGPIIIFDEPTAALDPVAEYEIYSDMNKNIQNKTAVYISHRMSSCRFCDEIAVFHKGELVEHGTHESLIQDKTSKYYELWNAQAEHYDLA